MKKIVTVVIAMLLVLGNISPVQADSEDAIEISLNNIKEIMLENSPNMKIAENDLEQSRETYDDLEDDYDDAKDDYNSIKSKIDALDKTSETYDSDYAELKKELSSLSSDVSSAKDKLESAKDDLKKARINYYATVASNVYSAQKAYIEYLSTLSDVNLNEENSKYNEKQMAIYKLQYESGFISKKEYDNYITSNNDTNYSYTDKKNQQEIALKNLKLSLGIDEGTKVTFKNDFESDLDIVSKIKFEDDVDEMLDNNSDIKLKEIALDSLNDSDDASDYEIDNAEINLEELEKSAKISFEQQYNTLMSSYNTLKSSNDILKNKQKDLSVIELGYSSGFNSKQDLDKSKLDLEEQKSKVENNKNAFYVDYLGYIKMKEGY